MVMSKQPVVEPAAVSDFFQEIRQLIWLKVGADFLLNCCRCAVCDDVIDLPIQPLQRLPCFGVFLVGRQFFLPLGNMIDTELSAIAAQGITSLVKI